jgi:WD40 repeat protein
MYLLKVAYCLFKNIVHICALRLFEILNIVIIILFLGDENIFDPVIDEYDRHKGTVTCIKSAPTKNLFVSCASDKEVRIYDFDQVCLNK